MGADLEGLEDRLGYRFRDRELLRRALTHKSHTYESAGEVRHTAGNNEQLEFLGDAVLGLAVSDALVARLPELTEGRLSKLKAGFVNSLHLCAVARELGLGDFLRLGRGEELSGGRQKRALLADALEAVIAAIYLDGGYEAAKQFVLTHVTGDLDALADVEQNGIQDYKGALQERAQRIGLPQPRYRVVGTRGPEHAKVFRVQVRIGDHLTAEGEGSSKKIASQRAAKTLLERLAGKAETAPQD